MTFNRLEPRPVGVEESGALGGTRTHDLRLRKPALYPTELRARKDGCRCDRPPGDYLVVPKVGFEPTRSYEHYVLNVACLPFHHFGTKSGGRCST